MYQALSAKGDQIDTSTKEVLKYREAMLFGFRTIQKKNILTINTIIEIQQILEENNAGIRKLPGTALRNSATGKVIYTPPDNTDVINSLLNNMEKFINLLADGFISFEFYFFMNCNRPKHFQYVSWRHCPNLLNHLHLSTNMCLKFQ